MATSLRLLGFLIGDLCLAGRFAACGVLGLGLALGLGLGQADQGLAEFRDIHRVAAFAAYREPALVGSRSVLLIFSPP
jgi:hypothetical protein